MKSAAIGVVALLATVVVCSADDRPLQPKTGNVLGGDITFAAFSPTGEKVATVANDRTVRLWSCEDCQLLWKSSPPEDGAENDMRGVAFSPDGKVVAAVRLNSQFTRSALLWNVADGLLHRQLDVCRSGPPMILTSLTFSPDGKSLWSSDGTSVYHWDMASGRAEVKQIPELMHGRVWFAVGNKPYLTSGYAKLYVHDALTGRAVFAYEREHLVWGDLYRGSSKFVAITEKRSLLLGDCASHQALDHLTPVTGTAAWASKANTSENLILYTTSGHIERWDLEKQQCTGVLERPVGITQAYFDKDVVYGRPQLQPLYVYHPTPMVISPNDSQALVLSSRRFALIPLDWQPPPGGDVTK